MKRDIYNVDSLISYCITFGVNISPDDRAEWTRFCQALKVLGYDESSFVALSSCAPKDARACWRKEKNPNRYIKSEDIAKGVIIGCAKSAGLSLSLFKEGAPMATNQAPTQVSKQKTKKDPEPPKITTYIPQSVIDRYRPNCKATALYSFLCRYFEEEEIARVFNQYRIGGTTNLVTSDGYRVTILPYINHEGKVVDGKMMNFNPLTGSRKTATPIFPKWTQGYSSWLITEINRKRAEEDRINRVETWCNFGDHLLQDNPSIPVAIVESEKTALMCAIVYPQFVWIATGSETNLTIQRCEPYKGRTIRLFPDRDATTDWENRANNLRAEGHHIEIDTIVRNHQGGPKDDIADIVLRYLDTDNNND